MNGGLLGVGEGLGRGVLGPGPGTIVGGVLAAATEQTDGGKISSTGQTMALVAVERGISELMGGA